MLHEKLPPVETKNKIRSISDMTGTHNFSQETVQIIANKVAILV